MVTGVDIVSDTVGATCCQPIKGNKARWAVEGSPRGKGRVSQFHCDNGARALGLVSIVRSHSRHQLTRNYITSCLRAIDPESQGLTVFKRMKRFLDNLLLCEGPHVTPASAGCIIQTGTGKSCLCFPPITS